MRGSYLVASACYIPCHQNIVYSKCAVTEMQQHTIEIPVRDHTQAHKVLSI